MLGDKNNFVWPSRALFLIPVLPHQVNALRTMTQRNGRKEHILVFPLEEPCTEEVFILIAH